VGLSRAVGLTDLRPDKLSQTSDELRRGIDAEVDTFRVDDLANVEPEGGFETLHSSGDVSARLRRDAGESPGPGKWIGGYC
jgi:hypothetical protein